MSRSSATLRSPKHKGDIPFVAPKGLPDGKVVVIREGDRVFIYRRIYKKHWLPRLVIARAIASSRPPVRQAVQPSPDPLLLEPYDWGAGGRPATKPLHYVPGVGFVVGQD